MKPNFHNENFARNLSFVMKFKATQKWAIQIYLTYKFQLDGKSAHMTVVLLVHKQHYQPASLYNLDLD